MSNFYGSFYRTQVKIVNKTNPNVKLKIVLDGVYLSRINGCSAIDLQEAQCGTIEFVLKNNNQINDLSYGGIVNPLILPPVNGAAAVRFTGGGSLTMKHSGWTVMMGGSYAVGNITFESGTYNLICENNITGRNYPIVGARDSYSCTNIKVGRNAVITAEGGAKLFGSQTGEERDIIIEGTVTYNGSPVK